MVYLSLKVEMIQTYPNYQTDFLYLYLFFIFFYCLGLDVWIIYLYPLYLLPHI
jgi:hypothetical protein